MAIFSGGFGPTNFGFNGPEIPDWLQSAFARPGYDGSPATAYSPPFGGGILAGITGQDGGIFGRLGQPDPWAGIRGVNEQPPAMGGNDTLLPPNAAPIQATPAAQQGPGLGDRLGAGFMGFTNARSPMQALGNLVQGLATGQRSDPQGMLLNQQQATFSALINRGVPASEAYAATVNPDILKTVAAKYFEAKPPTFAKIGQTALGQEQYGFVDPYKQTVTPVGGNATGANSSAEKLMSYGVNGKDFLDAVAKDPQFGQSVANNIKMMTEGRMSPPTSFAMAKPYWQNLIALASQYDPTFDATNWAGRVATRKDFTAGTSAKNITALNTVMGHMAELADKAEALGNYSFKPANYVANAYGEYMGDPRYKEFNLAATAVADEMAKVFRSTGMSDHEIAQWRNGFDAAGSPAQLKGVLKTGVNLIKSRMDASADQKNRGLGTNETGDDLLNEKGKAALEHVMQWAEGRKRGGAKNDPLGILK